MALELCLVLIDDFSEPLVKEMYFESSFSSVTPPPKKKNLFFFWLSSWLNLLSLLRKWQLSYAVTYSLMPQRLLRSQGHLIPTCVLASHYVVFTLYCSVLADQVCLRAGVDHFIPR